MSIQEAQHEDLAISNEKKGKRKTRHYDLEGQNNVICDYEQHGTSIISEKLMIPSLSQHLNLVSKALCRKHYNKLIVNAKKTKANNVCLHPKHQFYISTARHDTETKTKDENIDEMDIAEPSDDPNTRDEDFLLDGNIDYDNVDLFFERTINALTRAQFTI
ncbi:4532_t:CDS:2 [Funneliformis geosporum]|nr:4532_t:CDS:2 [Funneliformis geosporum]